MNLSYLREPTHSMPEPVRVILNIMKRTPSNSTEYNRLNTRELVTLISRDYHPALKDALDSVIVQMEAAQKVEAGDQKVKKALASIKLFRDLFSAHSGKEERLLFPLVNNPTEKKLSGNDISEIREFLGELKAEHRRMEDEIDRIRIYTDHYSSEPSASPSHKLAYAQLNEFEQDFNRLVFVEEEFLFPRLSLIVKKINPPS